MKTNLMSLGVVAFFAGLLLVACGGGGGGGDGPAPDVTKPTTTAVPGGGSYGTIQNVSLTANEPGMIYYSLDGTDPTIGGSNTLFGTSPLNAIQISNTTTLKFFSVDTAGNQEDIKTEQYLIDTASPSITFGSPTPGLFGLLTVATLTWSADEQGTYVVELGGSGMVNSGTRLASGTTSAGQINSQELKGIQLSYTTQNKVWVYVTDPFGHTGSGSLSLTMKPYQSLLLGRGVEDIEFLPDGSKAYMASGNNVIVLDTNPQSAAYHTIIKQIPVGTSSKRLASTSDNSRVYVTNQGFTIVDNNSVAVILTETDAVVATIDLGQNNAPYGIDIAPDGKRAYVAAAQNVIYIVDTDPSSATYNLIIDSISMSPLFLGGDIKITPNGDKAVVNWSGLIANAVDVIDVNPLSPTYKQIIGSPLPVISGPAGEPVITSNDSNFAYFTSRMSLDQEIYKTDLSNYSIVGSTPVVDGINFLETTSDDSYIFYGSENNNFIYIYNSLNLSSYGNVNLEGGCGPLAATPDNDRLYVVKNPFTTDAEIVSYPLK